MKRDPNEQDNQHWGRKALEKKSKRRTKKRKRPPTPTEQLSSDREREFRDAESKVEGRMVVEDRDFEDQTTGGIDIPERKLSRRKK